MTSFSLLLFALDSAYYLVCVFSFALVWHAVLFKEQYDAMGWKTPDRDGIALGFASVAVQAIILALGFQWFSQSEPLGMGVVPFCAFAFAFLWTSKGLADAAILPLKSKSRYLVFESIYLALQFVIYGAGLWVIHSAFGG